MNYGPIIFVDVSEGGCRFPFKSERVALDSALEKGGTEAESDALKELDLVGVMRGMPGDPTPENFEDSYKSLEVAQREEREWCISLRQYRL